MSKYYKKYVWKNCIPYGINPCLSLDNEGCFKIVSDPYRKRISIEEYSKTKFDKIIYDSALFDFRNLLTVDQASWQKNITQESNDRSTSEIRDHNDQLILIEKYLFQESRCIECLTFSPHGIFISKQKIFYKIFKEEFNGVIMYDSHNNPVMSKKYHVDETTQQFTELFEVNTNINPFKESGKQCLN